METPFTQLLDKKLRFQLRLNIFRRRFLLWTTLLCLKTHINYGRRYVCVRGEIASIFFQRVAVVLLMFL